MIADGLYSIDYRAAGDDNAIIDGALALLRDGRILGSDRWGGVFEGTYSVDPERRIGRVRLTLRIPPDGILVTGFTAGENGSTLEIDEELAGPSDAIEVMVGGVAVRVRLTYLGPPPP